MIDNTNESKTPRNEEFQDIPKFEGVASVNIKAINPNNEKLRKFGWNVPEDAPEPNYIIQKEKDGKVQTMMRLRLLAQIQDFEEKPIVALDFWCRPEVQGNKEGTKWRIIDPYVRTAWATTAEVKAKAVPQYSNGPADISYPYKPCHPGEEEVLTFAFKYLNITPLRTYDKKANAWVLTSNPGRLAFDDWAKFCKGDVKEYAEWLAKQPNNCVKVILGVKTTEDNKSYQTFLNSGYIGNGALPDRTTGEYQSARKLIDKFMESHSESEYSFSAEPVKRWGVTATEVVEVSSNPFGESVTTTDDLSDDGDLPFSDM